MTVTDRDVRQRIVNAIEAGGGELADEFWTIVAHHDISA